MLRGRRLPTTGFAYVAVLFALAIFGLGLAALGQSWSATSQRDKEEELMRIGDEFVRAIAAYYRRSPSTPKAYPVRLEDLLEDKRFVGTERHLRKLYLDPFTLRADWAPVRAPDGGIMGVHSVSDKNALRTMPFRLGSSAIIQGARYADWQFVFKAETK